jgi:hypothetical protein
MTKEEIDAAHPGLKKGCTATKDSSRTTEICGYSPSTEPILPSIPSLDTFGGKRVKSWLVMFRDTKAHTVGVTLPTASFDEVIASMKERYGAPTSEKASTVQNRMGASFDQTEVEWRVGGSIIAARRRASNINDMRILLSDEASIRDGAKGRESDTKAGAKDM